MTSSELLCMMLVRKEGLSVVWAGARTFIFHTNLRKADGFHCDISKGIVISVHRVALLSLGKIHAEMVP